MRTLAIDIGGAHLKTIDPGGRAAVEPLAVWRSPDRLAPALARRVREADPEQVLVTMTAELCDCFAAGSEGVRFVVDAAARAAGGRPLRFWSTRGRFLAPDEAKARPREVAASNWHALASAVAERMPGAELLIDIGSTTSDLIPLRRGRPSAIGLTDTQRLSTGELVYVGTSRTPLCALADRVSLRSRRYRVMAELFATSADVFVLTGDAPARPEFRDTADGRPLGRQEAAARVLRMIGADLESHTVADALDLAEQFAGALLDRLAGALEQVLEQAGRPREVVVSGSGEWLAARLCGRVLPRAGVHALSEAIGEEASAAACAWALRELAPVAAAAGMGSSAGSRD